MQVVWTAFVWWIWAALTATTFLLARIAWAVIDQRMWDARRRRSNADNAAWLRVIEDKAPDIRRRP